MAAKPTVLYEQHVKRSEKAIMAQFAGYIMPLWFTSIAQEHAAVRRAAGLFDCTHMGMLEVAGAQAETFLNSLTTNDVTRLAPGRAQYTYMLNEHGAILDDLIIYRRGQERFLVVVNAVNDAKIRQWLNDIQADGARCRGLHPEIRDLRSEAAGADQRVDIALQGPVSAKLLLSMADKNSRPALEQLPAFAFLETAIRGMDLIVSRTGYTGAKIGYELFVHPQQAQSLWQMLLEEGKGLGVVPCGLGARDSLRIEAGLPLYGHELAGEHEISPFEAGYGWAVKLDKKDFVGKQAMLARRQNYSMHIQRLKLPGEKGIRPLRENDPVLDADQHCIGWVTSCTNVAGTQIALAWIDRYAFAAGDQAGVYYAARNPRHVEQGRKETIPLGEFLSPDIRGTVTERFCRF